MLLRPTFSRWALCVLIACAVLAGCGRSQRWPALTEPATAVVRLDGKPVEGAIVILGPVGKGYASQGTTAADGRATLTTFRSGDGAVAGQYQVLVSWEDVKPNPAVTIPDPKTDLEGHRAALEAANRAGLSTHLRRQLLPQRYVSFDTSGLDTEIQRGVVNEVVLELSSQATSPSAKP
jgi:hypothetical protein